MRIGFLLFLILGALQGQAQINVIPLPQQYKYDSCLFVSSDSNFLHSNKVQQSLTSTYDSSLGNEGYKLRIDSNTIFITANTLAGQFYGFQTLQQLATTVRKGTTAQYYLPCIEITDQPQYQWRGMHLDVSRHFFSKEVVKQYLDLMARLKMNTFHWHLTDDQGWRIEIKKYPKLTETGAWRIEKDDSRYGGYYTQEDIREVVAYAAERFITIVPEIEIPGHSSAAIAAYPELSCTPGNKSVPGTWGIKKDIYCPNEFTIRFLKEVLDEVCGLFPGKYIHLGGDEAPKAAWKKSDIAQRLIKEQGLANEQQLQRYLMKLMEQHIALQGKRAIGWGEVLKGGSGDSMIVISWIDKHAGRKAAKMGNDVIMAPRFFCYFDYPHNLKDKRPAWWMTYVPVKKAYRFSPACKSLTAIENAHIIGGQANVWTEYITTEEQLRHHIFPRLAATAEALWGGKKDYRGFKTRLAHLGSKY